MSQCSSPSGLGFLAGLALAMVALPHPGAAAEPSRSVRDQGMSFTPLFDTNRRFKPKKTFRLRFRAEDKRSHLPLALKDLSFSLRHGPGDAGIALSAREVKKGVFEVPFTPAGPGQYWVVAALNGAPAGSMRDVRLGVVGVVDGLIELPPEADAELIHTRKLSSRSH